MSGGGGGSRGRNRHEEEHEEHVNHEAWVIPYADVLTLLMALFLVLWALGDPNADKTEVAADSFRRELSGGFGPFQLSEPESAGPLDGGGDSVFDGISRTPGETREELGAVTGARLGGATPTSAPDPDATPSEHVERAFDIDLAMPDGGLDPVELDPVLFDPVEEAEVELGDPLTDVERTVREEAIGSGLNTAVGFRREARGLIVTIVSDQVLFQEAEADVQPDGIVILDVIADSLRDLPNGIIVEGHTDARPISTARYPSNWELSTARATSVLRYLVEQRGLPGGRVAAAGYADTRPVAEGDDPASLARNRRVEIVVLATA